MKNSTVANPKEVISRKCLEKALPQIKFHWFTGEYDRADGYFQSVEDKYLVETKHRTNYTYEDIKHFGSIYIEVDKMNACL